MSDEKEVVKTEVDVAKQEVDVAKQEVDVAKQEIDVAAVVEKIEKRLNDVEAKVRKVITWKDKMQAWQDKMQAWKDGASANWKKFCQTHLGSIADDGKLSGNMRVALAVFSLAMFATATYAASTVWQLYNGDAVKGTCKAVSDDAGAMTLTVDKVVAASGVTAPITGDWTGDDLTANGGVTATLDINLPAGTTNTYATVKIKDAQTAAEMEDDGEIVWIWLNAYNASTEAIDYIEMDLETTDVTTNTEDAVIDFKVVSAGTMSSIARLGSTSAGVKTVTAGSGVSFEGAVGSVTPAAGAFTTVSSSSTADFNGAVTCSNVTMDASATLNGGAGTCTNFATVWASTGFRAAGSSGVTTNVDVIVAGNTTNRLSFVGGILTGNSAL